MYFTYHGKHGEELTLQELTTTGRQIARAACHRILEMLDELDTEPETTDQDPDPPLGTEYGIFDDEGCLERDCSTWRAAEAIRLLAYPDDDAYVARVCRDHPDEPAETCEACSGN